MSLLLNYDSKRKSINFLMKFYVSNYQITYINNLHVQNNL